MDVMMTIGLRGINGVDYLGHTQGNEDFPITQCVYEHRGVKGGQKNRRLSGRMIGIGGGDCVCVGEGVCV